MGNFCSCCYDENVVLMDDTYPELNLEGQICMAYVKEVYDGDTVVLNIKSSFGIHQYRLRLLGFDSPELRPKKKNFLIDGVFNEGEFKLHKKHGRVCRQYLKNYIESKIVIVECSENDDFGRPLGQIYFSQNGHAQTKHLKSFKHELQSVKYLMLKNTPSKIYSGNKKDTFNFEESQHWSEEYKHLLSNDSK